MCCGFGHMLHSLVCAIWIFAILEIARVGGVEQKGRMIVQIRLAT